MGLFDSLIDIAVDSVTDTVSLGARVTDAVLDTDLNGTVEDAKDIIKGK